MEKQEQVQVDHKRTNRIFISIILLLLSIIGGTAYYLVKDLPIAPVIVLHNQDSLRDQVERLQNENNLIDSITTKRIRQMRLDSVNLVAAANILKAKYYKAIKAAPDTCRSYIDTVYLESQKLDSLNKRQIAKKDSTIKDLIKRADNSDLSLFKTNQIIDVKNDSIRILTVLYKDYRRKFRWAKGIGWVKTGAAAYVGYKAGKILP